jgi:hypothetical protein
MARFYMGPYDCDPLATAVQVGPGWVQVHPGYAVLDSQLPAEDRLVALVPDHDNAALLARKLNGEP